MEPFKENRVFIGGVILLSCYLFLAIDDLIDDISDDMPTIHIYANVLFIVIGLLALFYYAHFVYRELKNEFAKRDRMTDLAVTESLKLKSELTELKKGVVSNINDQFRNWSLSDAEKEIAFLILKGFSFKEIASLRNTSEKTVRDQATKIYMKSGVKNRSELGAYFLEDLLS